MFGAFRRLLFPVPIADGGTGASTPAGARTNLGFQAIVAASDEVRNSGVGGTSFNNDSELTFALESGKQYTFEGEIYVTEGSTTPGIGVGISAPTHSAFSTFLLTYNNVPGLIGSTLSYLANTPYYFEANTTLFFYFRGSITTTAAGNLAFAFRQSTSSADHTTRKAGSRMRVTPVN